MSGVSHDGGGSSGAADSSLELPPRMFTAGQEPVGERVNVYHENSRIQSVLDAISEGEKNRLMSTVFGPFLDKIGKLAYSGGFGHFLLTKQLCTQKKREVWILFGGCPIRFGLREFKIVTSLPCRRYPPQPKKRKRIQAGEGSYYNKLFGRDGSVEVDEIITMLERNKPSDPEIRFKYICLCVVDGFLMPTSHHPKISKDHAEMMLNLEDFLKYPWGRAAFDLVINSIKERDPVSVSQRTVAIQGFYYALQLVMIEAVPALCEKPSPQAKYPDSDGDTEEQARPLSKHVSEKSAKNYVIPGYAKALDGKRDLVVDSIIPDAGDVQIDEEELSFPPDTEDGLVDNLMKLIHNDFEFCNKMFTGGFTAADIARMKLEREREKEAKNVKNPQRVGRRAASKYSSEIVSLADAQLEKIADLVVDKLKGQGLIAGQHIGEDATDAIETRISCRVDKSLQEMQKNILMAMSGIFSNPPGPHQHQSNAVVTPHGSPKDPPLANSTSQESPKRAHPQDESESEQSEENSRGDNESSESEEAEDHNTSGARGNTTQISIQHSGNNTPPEPFLEGQTSRAEAANQNDLVTAVDNQPTEGGDMDAGLPRDKEAEVDTVVDGQTNKGGPTDAEGLDEEYETTTLSTVFAKRSRSKRTKIPTSKIGEEFVCDPKIKTGPGVYLPKWSTSQVLKRFDEIAHKLQDPFSLKLMDGTPIQSSELDNLVHRQMPVSTTMVDSIMCITRILYKAHYPDKADKGIQFFDTKFASSLIKQFTKFKKATKRPYEFQPLQFELINGVRNPPSNDMLADAKLIYFPFNLDKKHWVGVCISLEEKKITVLDCNQAFCKTEMLVKNLNPVAVMFPYLIKDSTGEDGKKPPFKVERVSGITQNGQTNDSAVMTVLLIQSHATGGFNACRSVGTRSLTDEAKKLVALIYGQFF